MSLAQQTQNFEDAAALASEFIYSIDNLPHEVAHLLNEIKHKETRTQELQQEIDKDSARYIRHSLRASNPSPSSSVPSTPTSASRAPPSGGPNPKLIPKIAAAYAEIQKLADEKCVISQQAVDLISRTRSRLDGELAKVRALQGEDAPPVLELLPSRLGAGGGSGLGAASQLTESLRNVMSAGLNGQGVPLSASGSISVPPAISAVTGASSNKKRRIAGSPSIKLTPAVAAVAASSPSNKRRSSSPAVAPTTHTGSHQRSRLSRQIHPPAVDDEADAEGEPDAEEDAEGDDDDTLYCFCQKRSYGDMIACDNDKCPYEWFHLSCVGMKQPLPDKWYCSVCISKGAGQPVRKGRKK